MICLQTVKEFFGFAQKPEVTQPLTEGGTKSPIVKQGVSKRPPRPPVPLRKATRINARNYYRRGGRYYSIADDSLIEDAILLLELANLYGAGEIFERDEVIQEHWNVPETNIFNGETDIVEEPTEDLLDIDVSETPVVEVESVGNSGNYTAPETPSYSAPEPEPVRQESYSSGYSDSSSSYDSGSSDSGSDD